MNDPLSRARKPLGILTVLGLVIAGLAMSPLAASADTLLPGPAPVEQRNAATVTSDALPTVQIDGVVWSQVIVGNTVFAGGSFQNARPAGAAQGTNLMTRTNLLSYDINTGVATSFAPTIDGVVKTVAVSPNGKTLYIGGSFNNVNGQVRHEVAAFDTATGALLTTWKPAVGGSYVNTIVATNTTIYVGGLLGAGAGVTRKNLMAFNATNGALLAWAPTTDLQVDTMVLTPAQDKLIIGGRFGQVNGAAQRGLAALDLNSGAMLPWLAPQTVINGLSTGSTAGKAGIFSLTADANAIYGTGWVYSNKATGNLEGVFSADPSTGAINWIADCHGDHYGVYSDGTNVYSTSHQHACETMGGAPQSDPATINMRNATAYTAAAKGHLLTSVNVNDIYADWGGYPAPAAINWAPDWTTGYATGEGQAGWDMTGNGSYLLVGGEFQAVNGKTQQGIVRFAINPPGGPKQGPRLSGTSWVGGAAKSNAAGVVRISVPANWDRDDMNLTYTLYRTGTAAPIATQTMASTFWNTPTLSFIDTGRAPGSTQTYRVFATDADGNTNGGPNMSVVVSNQVTSPYAEAVQNDGANLFWRLGSTGSTETDWVGTNDGTIGSTVGQSASGAVAGDSSVGSTFNGSSTSDIYTSNQVAVGPAYSLEFWFNTTTTTGGKIVGYGNAPTGDSSNYDRHVYMTNGGQIVYGNYDGNTRTITTPQAYNDGKWHQVVATQGSGGMALYVDGQSIGSDSTAPNAQSYSGYWRIGGDNLNGWPNQPSTENFTGQVDEFSVYPTVLTAAQAATHYGLAQGQTAPTAAFTSTSQDLTASFDASGSTAPGGQTISSYSWNFGDGSPAATGVSPTHTYSTAGTYPVTLTAKSSSNLTSTATNNVVVTAAHPKPVANFTNSSNGLTAAFDATGSTVFDGATITRYAWTFGDGSSATTAQVGHTYGSAGTYPVSLVVTDSTGASSTAGTANVTVAHSAPVASFTKTVNGLGVAVDGSGSAATDGATLIYDWNWGDGSAHGTGSTATHSYASAGNYPVTLKVTDSFAVPSAPVTSTVTATHAAPVASFTGSPAGFALSVNASGSAASDGASLTYDWNWGDGSAHGTGVTATHTYAGPATYPVTLTVTDSLGVSSSPAASNVVITHAAPVAAFSASAVGRALSVNAAGSSASDGATLAYDWNWGDGSTHGTGATATHNYATDGSKTITLTVTDSLGSTGATNKVLVVTAITYVAADDFERTSTSNWGTALVGGSWSTATGLSVSGGFGKLTGTSNSTRTTSLTSVSAKDVNASIVFSNDKIANGGGTQFNFLARKTAAGNYTLKVRVSAAGVVTVNVAKTVGTTETLFPGTVLTGYTYQPGDQLALRFVLTTSGANTVLQGRAWLATGSEPTAWTTTATDAQAELQTAGQIGITNYISGSSTAGTIVTSVDNLTVQ